MRNKEMYNMQQYNIDKIQENDEGIAKWSNIQSQ